MVTTPTVGRKVWFRPNASEKLLMVVNGDQPLDATIVCVWGDRYVNLVIFDANGNMFKRTSVVLLQDTDVVSEGCSYAEWMPYQIKQAIKHAAEEVAKD